MDVIAQLKYLLTFCRFLLFSVRIGLHYLLVLDARDVHTNNDTQRCLSPPVIHRFISLTKYLFTSKQCLISTVYTVKYAVVSLKKRVRYLR